MSEESKAGTTCLSRPEFLTALERSGVLPEAKWREVHHRLIHAIDLDSSLAVAERLVKEGTLTEFQARRLLQGKKSLAFGRYALIDHIGQGARGRVFKARQRLMDRVVALKVLLPDGALSETIVSRFFREMKIVGLLDHPNVVRAIDADVHDGCPYIVMEYLEGDDLERVVAREGPLPQEQVIEYMAQTARGLAHAHEKGVIHRDVKPTNLFLVNTGIVKLLDLGFGELVGMTGKAGNIFDTDDGIVVGTTDFMSPEQVKDEPIDARTDLFSLGCTMYRLLTGVYAFPGMTREDRLLKRVREPHVPITSVRRGLSHSLVTIVDQLLANSPDDRFGSAVEVAEALEALISPAGRTDGATGTKPGTRKRSAGAKSLLEEPEAPLDSTVIESALRPADRAPREAARLVEKNEPKSRASKNLSSHRKSLEEDEGVETGREAQKQYRNEVIQMKRAMAELRAIVPSDQEPSEVKTRLERIGEKLGDYLAEPSPMQIFAVILIVLLVLALAMATALG
jgi:serine/threonine-protein kinase